MKYYLQTRAPAGNWVDHLGADMATCVNHGKYLVAERHHKPADVRVIERSDRVVWEAK